MTALSHQPKGAWPLHFGEAYPEDAENLRDYARLSKTEAGFNENLARHVWRAREVA